MNKVIRVNTQTGAIATEDLKKGYEHFGGRGLIAHVLNDEVNPKCDPLGAENKLILATQVFAGSGLTTGNRLAVGGKSPLTGTIKESNVGGSLAGLMSGHGIKMILIEGLPKDNKWKILKIDKAGKAELIAADEYAGLNNYALVEKLQAKYGKVAIASIGMAGERGYANSSVQVTDYTTGHPSRAAARGGLGSLMGSKKIKAVVIEEPEKRAAFQFANRDKFMAAAKRLADNLTAEGSMMRATTTVGTINLVEMTGLMAFLPVRNFSGAYFGMDRIRKINGPAFLEKLKANGGKNQLPCQLGCVVRCSNVYNDSKGQYVTGALEYETVALMGANCDIDDLDWIAQADRICDDLGVDTIETGATIAVCMDAGKIPWGDKKAAMGLLQEMVNGTEFGKLLGKGTAAVGKALGAKRIPAVKGQSLSGYDPRTAAVTGVTFATTPMGADHTAGPAMMPNGDMMGKVMRASMSGMMQLGNATMDNVCCMYGYMGTMADPTIVPDLFSGAFGGEWNADSVRQIGMKTLELERKFNKAAGFTSKDDVLPEFFSTEVAPSTGAVFDMTEKDMTDVFKF